ncbi:MAG TPA: 2-amino-4-hydroxy-6-hydroxymethyldihydropteridine diphosphokinase [Firmicutes bacterium]|nr:2-amino-4-hydroxy-6-hydroxymethyldihydropteridine diphosphokinase [Bacillota bacterium]
MPIIAVALGTNIGDREEHLRKARAELTVLLNNVVFSRVYESEPVGYLDQPWFLNQVCVGETQELPLTLLYKFKMLEKAAGRTEGPRFGPRPLDLDILFYGSWVMASDLLTIPHPRLLERSFVIRPLLELVPDWVDPRSGLGLKEIWETKKDRLSRCYPVI